MKPIQTLCRIALLATFLTACIPSVVAPEPTPVIPDPSISGTATDTPFLPAGYVSPIPTLTSTETLAPDQPSPTPFVPVLWVDATVPEYLRQFAGLTQYTQTSDPAAANVRLSIDPQAAAQSLWVFALVTPFPSLVDNITSADLLAAWGGAAVGPFAGQPLWMDESTLAAFTALWGTPGSGSVRVADSNSLLDIVWAARPGWALIPFERIEPRWKVLSVDGRSPLRNDLDLAAYPLKISFGLQPAAFPFPATNRDPTKLTVLAMTGVTALVRGTADRMEKHGVLYPGEEVRSVLTAADVTHISNEIPFYADCPIPDPWTESLRFCSDIAYVALLEDVGTDVVELTGNHLMDYGSEAALLTLDMYDQRSWAYFGGGRNLADSFEAALVTHNGNKLAFLGCNFFGPASDFATDAGPGSTPCDFARLEAEIARLRAEGYLPIVTFQYTEYYQPYPTDAEREDFRQMADAGAVVVSGSQSHVPAAMEFYADGLIHYGLGNLFFDQMSHLMPDGSISYATRNVFIDRHIFYDGRYLGTELLTYILEDYARPRLMTERERIEFLQYIFAAAGW